MKRFIGISLFVTMAAKALACAGGVSHNFYLFSVCQPEEFSNRVQRIANDNWQAYLGTSEPYYYFDADEIRQTARKKGDKLMLSYVDNLNKYLDCAQQAMEEKWDYPTKQQLAQRRQTLLNVQRYAQSQLKSRLRSQHALLFMRCNMMLGQHQANADFWQQTAGGLIETVYKDMMKNIYAGALLHTGQTEQAVQLFAQMGDWKSLMTICYKQRSCDAIRQEYLRNPNSPALPFLVQDFVNNAQEAVDFANNGEDYYVAGKLFIRDIKSSEARQMCQLAAQAVSEGKTQQPALWQSAKAWLEFLFFDRQQAKTDIGRALTMDGTQREKDNARVLALFIDASQATNADYARGTIDQRLADDLQWLGSQSDDHDNHYQQAIDRTVHQVLAPRLLQANRFNSATALYNVAQSYHYEETIDTMRVDRLISFIGFSTKGATAAQLPLDRWLQQKLKADATALTDIVGTKYLRLCQWEKATAWLEKVPAAFISQQAYAPYAAYRSTDVEPWIERQWLTDRQREAKPQLTENPKLAFARTMQQMEASLPLLQGLALSQRCYDLGVRYAQTCPTGDCWFIMRNSKSVNDSARTNETDLAARAIDMLKRAAQTSNAVLRERALFALAYGELYRDRWYEHVWSERLNDFTRKPLPATQHYKAMAGLHAFEKAAHQKPAYYVSRCDEYIQFRKQMK